MTRPCAVLALALAAALALPRATRAQATRGDSAAILLDAARQLDLEGKGSAAEAVLDLLVRRYAETTAAAAARTRLAGRKGEPERSGRLELLAWGAIDGAWLGIAIPAALSASSTAPYGIGLVAGGPLGFVVAKAYADHARPSLGQARAITFAFNWGTWQSIGWLAALTSGDLSAGAAFGTAVAGGIGGAVAAAAWGRPRTVPVGVVTAVSSASYWGTWFGLMGWTLFDLQGDGGLRLVLAAGDAGLLIAALTAPRDISEGRVWLTSAAGLAGMAVGGGLDLLLRPSSAKVAIAIPTATSAVGLLAGIALAKGAERVRSARGPSRPGSVDVALLEVDETGAHLGLPAPRPTLQPAGQRGPRVLYRPALAVPLLHASF